MRTRSKMSHCESNEFEEPRTSRSYFGLREGRSLYANFLSEDLGAQVMPLNQRYSSQKNFKAYFEGEITECQKFRDLLVGVPQYQDNDENDFICDVINSIAANITKNGTAYFELLASINSNNKQYKLHPFFGKNIYFLKLGVVQIFRKAIEHEFETKVGGYGFVWLKNSAALRINFPNTLCSKSKYLRILNLLKKYGDTPSSLLTLDSSGKFMDVGFDFKVAQKNTVLFRDRLTHKLGYDFRNSDGEYITEFFMVNRFITFRIAKVLLRDHILNQLNSFAKKIGINSKIVVEGLPSHASLLDIQYKLQNSEINFSSALEESRI